MNVKGSWKFSDSKEVLGAKMNETDVSFDRRLIGKFWIKLLCNSHLLLIIVRRKARVFVKETLFGQSMLY